MTETKVATAIVAAPTNDEALEKAAHLMVTGDLSKMNMKEKADFLTSLARAYNLSPFPRPFELIPGRNGKEIIYANKSCTDQLRKIHGVSLEIVYAGPLKIGETVNDKVYIVKAKATDKEGRYDEAIGAISLQGLTTPEEIANAIMRCETKGKRRATLSICGLSFPDETEVIGQAWNGYQQAPQQPGPRVIDPNGGRGGSGPMSTTQPVINAILVESKLVAGDEPLPPVGVK